MLCKGNILKLIKKESKATRVVKEHFEIHIA